MAERIRYHLDEHIPRAVADGLKRRGIDVTLPWDVGLGEGSDLAHIDYATSTGRVMVTQDTDFLRHHREGVHHAGIVYCQQGSRSVGEMLRSLVLIFEVLSPEEMHNHVEFI